MDNIDDYDPDYNGYYLGDEADEECDEKVSFVRDGFSQELLEDTLIFAGVIQSRIPQYIGDMEKLVFIKGDPNETYSSDEIHYIEGITSVYVYQDYFKKLNRGVMTCRAIATILEGNGHDALRSCIAFEKIIDKAFNGFNIFFFITDECVYFGCKLFSKNSYKDCILSQPLSTENNLDEITEELGEVTTANFTEYYNQITTLLTPGIQNGMDYEDKVMRRRGLQYSYLESLDCIERDTGSNLFKEKQRYIEMFQEDAKIPFTDIIQEVEDSLSFIHSNKINTYEMLFDAEEMMRLAIELEEKNTKEIQESQNITQESKETDEEERALLDKPEEMIKLLKKKRGIKT